MKNLQEIKNTYAQELGHEDWKTFLNYYGGRHPEWFEQHWTEICIRAQKAALEKASENATMTVLDFMCDCGQSYNDWSIDRTSITNPENLIR